MSACQQFTIELLKIFISWPVFAIVFAIYVMREYGDVLFAFLGKLDKVDVWGVSMSANDQQQQIAKQGEKNGIQEDIEKLNNDLDEAKRELEDAAQKYGAEMEQTVRNYLDIVNQKDKEIDVLKMKEWLLNIQIEDMNLRNELAGFSKTDRGLIMVIQKLIISLKKANSDNPLQEAINKIITSKSVQQRLLGMRIIDDAGKVTNRGEKIISIAFESWSQPNN